nr:MAG: replication associated protein [Cressdnaviricota sp.]
METRKFQIKRTHAQIEKLQEAKPPVDPPVSITHEERSDEVQGGSGERSEHKGQRGTCWSVTINNPSPGEERCDMPGWKMTGQFEVGTTGTRHWQGCLQTPQVRWAAVKKMYPRGNISLARNEIALKNYVRKEDTRASAIVSSGVVNIFQFQDIIAGDWKVEEFNSYLELFKNRDRGEVALIYCDGLVRQRIRAGQRGAEWIAMNPLWRSVWKNFYADIIERYASSLRPSCSESEGELRTHGGESTSPPSGCCAEGDVDICEESVGDSEEEGGNEICG